VVLNILSERGNYYEVNYYVTGYLFSVFAYQVAYRPQWFDLQWTITLSVLASTRLRYAVHKTDSEQREILTITNWSPRIHHCKGNLNATV